MRTLLTVVPHGDVQVAHALALPAGLALLGAAVPLARRRMRAMQLAVALLVTLGVLNVLKGLDVEEALLSWVLAGGLWRSRRAFWVHHDARDLGQAARFALVVLAGAGVTAVALDAAMASHDTVALSPTGVAGQALALLTLTGHATFRAPFAWLPDALGALGVLAATLAAARLVAPLRPDRRPGTVAERRRAASLVRRHGTDSLSAFTLRGDLARRFSADGRATAAYRIEGGALLVAGDPVGPDDAVAPLLDDLVELAHRHGLALGAVGASDGFSERAQRRGMRRLYLGDEAIIDTGPMDLAGGATKSLRKAVNRIARHGFTAELRRAGELDELHAVSEHWRDGAPERGFSMAADTLVDELLGDATVVLARDGDGHVRGFLHFLPVPGRRAVSLAAMRRERDTPNGLTDFLVVEAARLLGERGVEDFSLNFALCGRWLRAPGNRVEQALASTLRVADRWFQIERLLRFNEKFRPRWQPRYLLFERPAQLPRVALAALWVEGQVPRPERPRRRPVGAVPVRSAAR